MFFVYNESSNLHSPGFFTVLVLISHIVCFLYSEEKIFRYNNYNINIIQAYIFFFFVSFISGYMCTE